MYHILLFLLVISLSCEDASAQVEGPDSNGKIKFFFNNYTGALVMQNGIRPSIEFHPVIGGKEFKYIRYENWMSANVTTMQEVDPNGNVVASEFLLDLEWTFQHTEETNETTGNVHTFAAMHTKASNGALVSVITESWSQGSTHLYGTYTNVVPASCIEMSFVVSEWPFQDKANGLWVSLLINLDGEAIPTTNDVDPYRVEGVMVTDKTSISVWLMNYAIVDGIMTPLAFAIGDYDIYNMTHYEFTFKFPSFNKELVYDPNFEVLMNSQPDCSKVHECDNGACVEDGKCVCRKGFSGPDCRTVDPDYNNIPEQSSDDISVLMYVSTGVGAFVVVVVLSSCLIMWRIRERRRSRTSLSNVVKKSQSIQSFLGEDESV